MTTDQHPPRSRRLTPRRATATLALTIAAVGSLAAPAYAAPPTEWADPENGTPLDAFILLGVVPLAAILVITLLTYLPSMMNRHAGTSLPAYSGGPRQSTDELHADQDRGPGTGHPDSYQGGQRGGDSGGSGAQF